MILRGMPGTLTGHHLRHVWGIIWGMSGTTSGAHCQHWTANRGATCICDAVFIKLALEDFLNEDVKKDYKIPISKEFHSLKCH